MQSTPFVVRAAVLFLAAALALTAAGALQLHNPFWAAMPVWVVAQPYRQDMVIRSGLRLAGTIVGAGLAWGVLTGLSTAFGQAAALGVILGLATLAAFWIGTIYSYGALLVGITAAVVVVPALDHPVDALALAVDRFQCTLIGVAAVSLLTFAFTPLRESAPPARVAPDLSEAAKRAALALGAGSLAAGLVLGVSGPAAIAAGMSLCVFSSIIGATPNNRMILDNLVPGALIGVLTAIAYRILANGLALQGMELIWLALPFLAAGAVFRSHPKTAPLGLDANMCFLLAAEAGAQGHSLPVHLVSGAALVGGAVVVTLAYQGLVEGRGWRVRLFSSAAGKPEDH